MNAESAVADQPADSAVDWTRLGRLFLRFLSSLRLGLFLIFLLMAVCIAGSMVSAQKTPDHAKEWVFNTWWFLGLMGLLLVNLCLCSWEKSYIALTLYKKRNFITFPAFYKKAANAAILRWAASPDALEKELQRDYTIVRRQGNAFYVQRGLIGRLGATIIHIGLLWTMSAGFYRILADEFRFGVFDATVILPEGLTTNNYFTRRDRLEKPTAANLDMHTMPFNLRLLDFHVENYPGSTVAKRYSSLVEVQDPKGGSEIHEVTMETPLLFNGYKVTQNSYSPSDKVSRGRFQIYDKLTGQIAEVDAAAGDPVALYGPGLDGLFFQTKDLASGADFAVVRLATREVIEKGTIDSGTAPGPLPIDLSTLGPDLVKSRYSFLIAAMFPNFTFDEAGKPTTKDETFANPAVLVMLFKNGKPNGYMWLFSNQEAARIMGQPHPEVEMVFDQYRLREGKDGKGGLMDYEVRVAFKDRETAQKLGEFWVPPGRLTELPGVSATVLDKPNVRPEDMKPVKKPGAKADEKPAGGAGETQPAEGGMTAKTRFAVTYLGATTGYVSYLGFMRDPSVVWLYIGCIIVVLGTMVAFVFTYREGWFWYDEAEGLVYAATAVRGTSPQAHRKFNALIDRLAAVVPRTP